MCFMPMDHIKRFYAKILKFAHFRAELQSRIVLAPIYGHAFFAHNSVIFGPNSIAALKRPGAFE